MSLLAQISETDTLVTLTGYLSLHKIFSKSYEPYVLTSIEIVDDMYTELTFMGYSINCGGDGLTVILPGTQLDDGEFTEVYYTYNPDVTAKWHSIVDGVDKSYHLTRQDIITTKVWKRTGT